MTLQKNTQKLIVARIAIPNYKLQGPFFPNIPVLNI